MSDKQRVHFTHHACLVVAPSTSHEEQLRITEAISQLTGLPSHRGPTWTFCEHARPARARHALRFTTNIDDVTCGRCSRRGRWMAGIVPADRMELAWVHCCRYRSAACPGDNAAMLADDIERIADELEVERRTLALDMLLGNRTTWATLVAGCTAFSAAIRGRMLGAAAEMDESTRASAAAALHELALAADLADEVDRLISGAQRRIGELRLEVAQFDESPSARAARLRAAIDCVSSSEASPREARHARRVALFEAVRGIL